MIVVFGLEWRISRFTTVQLTANQEFFSDTAVDHVLSREPCFLNPGLPHPCRHMHIAAR